MILQLLKNTSHIDFYFISIKILINKSIKVDNK